MTDPHLPMENRLHELLADRAIFGLSDQERTELDSLLQAQPHSDAEEFDRLAANLAIAGMSADVEPLPPHLEARIIANSRPNPSQIAPTHPVRRDGGRVLAGLVGLAAGLLVAASYLALSPTQADPDPAQRRAELISKAREPGSGVVVVDWAATEDPAGRRASGDVVWNPATQEGYMRFRGLAGNDPASEQYQLWVFDADRDDRYPVDGGVFNIPAGGDEVVVPIRTKLPVAKATLFAITVERPGGVVVSTRERLPLLAKVPGS